MSALMSADSFLLSSRPLAIVTREMPSCLRSFQMHFRSKTSDSFVQTAQPSIRRRKFVRIGVTSIVKLPRSTMEVTTLTFIELDQPLKAKSQALLRKMNLSFIYSMLKQV